MITCSKCDKVGPEELFMPSKGKKQMPKRTCRECRAAYMKAWMAEHLKDPENEIKLRERMRQNTRNREARGVVKKKTPQELVEACRLTRKRNPEKYKARQAVQVAIATGKLVRQNCWCGKKGEAHHPDYSKPLLVEWSCRQHHMEEHVRLKDEETRKRAAQCQSP